MPLSFNEMQKVVNKNEPEKSAKELTNKILKATQEKAYEEEKQEIFAKKEKVKFDDRQ